MHFKHELIIFIFIDFNLHLVILSVGLLLFLLFCFIFCFVEIYLFQFNIFWLIIAHAWISGFPEEHIIFLWAWSFFLSIELNLCLIFIILSKVGAFGINTLFLSWLKFGFTVCVEWLQVVFVLFNGFFLSFFFFCLSSFFSQYLCSRHTCHLI